MTDSQIVVTATLPPAPLVLVDSGFVNALAEVEQRVASLKIVDATTAQTAADLQRRLTTAGQKLRLAHDELKAPFLDAGRKIDEATRGPEARINQAKRLLSDGLVAFQRAEQERIAAAERARLAELARLERIRLAEEAAEKLKADRLAREAQDRETERLRVEAVEIERLRVAGLPPPPSPELSFDDPEPVAPPPPPEPSETERQIAALRYAPAVESVRPQGAMFRVTLKHRVSDPRKLPPPFQTVTANDRAISSAFEIGWKDGMPLPVCDGVEFTIDRQAISTRQRI